jgi:hypothetical protein
MRTPLSLLAALLLFVGAPAGAGDMGRPLDRPDLLAYSSSEPVSSGAFVEDKGNTGVAFFGNLSAVRNISPVTTMGGNMQQLLGFSLSGYAGGFGLGGDVARLYFALDEPDSFSRTTKKITIQQKAWLTMSATGLVGADTFATEPTPVEDCSAKASLKDKTGSRIADQASLKVKCKSIDDLLAELGLTGAPAQAVRDVFGATKVSISAKDTDGPEIPD